MIIVYESNTGHTKKYAEMLGEELNIPVYSLNDNKISDDEIIYMGWVFADKISGYDKVKNKNIKCVAAVGMNLPNEKTRNKLIQINNLNKPLFCLQGGIDYSKLKGLKKILLKMVAKQVIKENKSEDKALILMFKNGGYSIKKENLRDIIDYIKQKEV